MTRMLLLVPAIALLGCGGRADVAEPAGRVPSSDARPVAPWSGAALDASAVPSVYVTQWRAAENRASCALIAPVTSGQADATARAATFSGGWAVAYDIPDRRSAFGVAGAGVSAGGDVYDDWPHRIEWRDGSEAGYGPEGGGAGPKQLAYLTIAGQDCLYNVWSELGVAHLEWLLGQLRFVRVDA